MHRIMLAALLAGLLVLGVAPAASAHVHVITPLPELGCRVDNAITGANRVNTTPAADDGGPISAGLIPAVVGNADLVPFQDGGFGAANDDVCPAG